MYPKIFLVIIFINTLANAQWLSTGSIICDTSINGHIDPLPQIAADGAGGAYICWRDVRDSLGGYSVYAQRVDSTGKMMWRRNGIAIVQANNHQEFSRITPDGKGGGYIAWEDSRIQDTFVYAQRIDKQGNFLWQTNGIKVAETPGLFISINSDNQNSLLLGWTNVKDVYVQRLDSMGNRMWGDSGVQVTNRPGYIPSNDVSIISDGVGGAIVAWAEGIYPDYYIYTQRVDSSGKICWTKNGVLLSNPALGSTNVGISSDAKGGAIINWSCNNSTGGVQRINKGGNLLWTSGGVVLDPSGTGGGRRNTADGKSGAFVGQGLNIHHLDSSGNKLYGSGAPYFDTLGSTHSSQTNAGVNGVYNFSDALIKGGFFILVQWIDNEGKIRFGTKGIKMTPGILAYGSQLWPRATSNGKGGALVCWADAPIRGYSKVFVGKVDTTGVITKVRNESFIIPQIPTLEQNYPNPFNPTTNISYQLSNTNFVVVKVYDILGREIRTLVSEIQQPGNYLLTFNSTNISSGVYFYRLISNNFTQTKKMIVTK